MVFTQKVNDTRDDLPFEGFCLVFLQLVEIFPILDRCCLNSTLQGATQIDHN